MKRMLVAVAVVCIGVMMADGGTIIYKTTTANRVLDPFGVRIPSYSTTYDIGLYRVVNGLDPLPIGGDDVQLGLDGAWLANGLYNNQANGVTGGYSVYVQVLNPTGQMFLRLYGTGMSSPQAVAALGTVDVFDWNSGGNSVGGTLENHYLWQPIPEPGSIALFGIGLLTVLARRRMKS